MYDEKSVWCVSARFDAGVPVLAMHAPFEIVAKLDCYMTYKAMKAVYEN